MIKKYLTFISLFLLFVNFCIFPAFAQRTGSDIDRSLAKVKDKIVKRSKGKDRNIKLKLSDGRTLGGEVTHAGEDAFVLEHKDTKQSATIDYRDVAKVKGKTLSTTGIIAIGALAGAAAIVLAVVLLPICNEGGC